MPSLTDIIAYLALVLPGYIAIRVMDFHMNSGSRDTSTIVIYSILFSALIYIVLWEFAYNTNINILGISKTLRELGNSTEEVNLSIRQAVIISLYTSIFGFVLGFTLAYIRSTTRFKDFLQKYFGRTQNHNPIQDYFTTTSEFCQIAKLKSGGYLFGEILFWPDASTKDGKSYVFKDPIYSDLPTIQLSKSERDASQEIEMYGYVLVPEEEVIYMHGWEDDGIAAAQEEKKRLKEQ